MECVLYYPFSLSCNLVFIQTEYARFDKGRFVYRINRSPMCEYMTSFIRRLKHLPEKYMMNSVLENFTILQVSRDEACFLKFFMNRLLFPSGSDK